jgi:multidrug efflux pump subunit AcrA (membrane-fusion protein)
MKLWKTSLVVLGIIGATAGALALMNGGNNMDMSDKPDEPVWDVRTQTAELGAYQPQIKLIGQLEPVQDISEVALLSAKVTQIFHQDGMQVEAGDLILQLDDFDAQLQLQQTQADLADLKARIQMQSSQQQLDIKALEVEKASLDLLQKQLTKQKAISNTQAAIDDLNQQIQRQQFAVLQREAAIANHALNDTQLEIQQRKLELALSAAQRNVSYTQLKAPFAGTLAQVFVKEGQRVNPGSPLFRLYSTNDMSVQVQLPPRLQLEKNNLNGVAIDQNRRSTISFSRSEAQLNAGQSGFKAWFSISDDAQWLPGDIANLTLNLPAKNNSFKIPAASVFQDRWIYSVNDQRLEALEVSVLGSIAQADENLLVVQTKQPVNTDLRLLTTRLNNPTTGMKIYEEGVDPEPVEETGPEENEASDSVNSDDTIGEVSDEDA